MAFKSDASLILREGGKSAVVNYAYDTWVAPKLSGTLGNFAGEWSDAAISFGVAYLMGRYGGGKWSEQGRALFAHRAALALEANLSLGGGSGGGGAAAPAGGTWYSAALARGPPAMQTYGGQ